MIGETIIAPSQNLWPRSIAIFTPIWIWLQILLLHCVMMRSGMVFYVVTPLILRFGSPVDNESSLEYFILYLMKPHIYCLGCLGFIVLFRMTSVVELSVLIGVAGCGWPNSSRIMYRFIASWLLWNDSSGSTSAADVTTFRNMAHDAWNEPFGGGGWIEA